MTHSSLIYKLLLLFLFFFFLFGISQYILSKFYLMNIFNKTNTGRNKNNVSTFKNNVDLFNFEIVFLDFGTFFFEYSINLVQFACISASRMRLTLFHRVRIDEQLMPMAGWMDRRMNGYCVCVTKGGCRYTAKHFSGNCH